MKKTFFLLVPSVLILAVGCGKQDEGQVSSSSPTAATDSNSSAGQPVPITEEPPPLVPVLSEDAAAKQEGGGLVTAEGAAMDDLQKLNYALNAYAARQLPEPKGFEDLVRAGFLRSVPVAPPGKKYVIDVKTISVKLVDAN